MGKGGGGGGGTPQAHSVPQLNTIMGSTQTLGGYTSQLLQPLMSMFNWASDIATGGNVNPALASWPYSNVLGPGPNAQVFNPFGGLGTPGGSIFGTGQTIGPQGAGGQNTYQSLAYGAPGSATTSPGGMLLSSGGGGAPSTMGVSQQQPQSVMFENQPSFAGQPISAPSNSRQAGQMVTPMYDATTQKLVGFQDSNGNPIQGGVPGAVVPLTYPWPGSGQQGGWQSAGDAGAGGGGFGGNLLGPFLSQAWSSIGDEKIAAGMIPGLMQQTAALTKQAEDQSNQLFGGVGTLTDRATQLYREGQDLYKMSTTGSGLFPSQKAFVDQGVNAQKAALAQQLASEGLGSSTQLAQLQGEAEQAGAATAGQLIQGNLSVSGQQTQLAAQQTGLAQQQVALAQASQKIALGGQELSLGEQTALTQELAGISSQSSGLQQQMWTQAMQGMGLAGQMIGTALSAFGYETQAASVQANLNIANAQIAAQAQQASQQSSGSGFSSLLGGLGSLLGSGGGGGGGLLGGLGGLFGGIGAAAGGVGAAGSATGAAVSAIGLAAVA